MIVMRIILQTSTEEGAGGDNNDNVIIKRK